MKTLPILFGFALAGSFAALPALAQSSEEIMVTGSYGKLPDNVQTVSQAVSYADLDLSTKAGKDELRRRISLTSRYLCEKLGESSTGTSLIPSCRDAATKDAMARVGTIEEGFAPRGSAWVAGTAWSPPYSAEWAKKYP